MISAINGLSSNSPTTASLLNFGCSDQQSIVDYSRRCVAGISLWGCWELGFESADGGRFSVATFQQIRRNPSEISSFPRRGTILRHRKVSSRGIAEQRVHPINAVCF